MLIPYMNEVLLLHAACSGVRAQAYQKLTSEVEMLCNVGRGSFWALSNLCENIVHAAQQAGAVRCHNVWWHTGCLPRLCFAAQWSQVSLSHLFSYPDYVMAASGSPQCCSNVCYATERHPVQHTVNGKVHDTTSICTLLLCCRVVVVERGPLQGRQQEWNISRKELQELVSNKPCTNSDSAATICVTAWIACTEVVCRYA